LKKNYDFVGFNTEGIFILRDFWVYIGRIKHLSEHKNQYFVFILLKKPWCLSGRAIWVPHNF